VPDLSYVPDFVLVVIAAWLGATILGRPSRSASSVMFAVLSFSVAVWASAWIVHRLTASAEARVAAGSITAVAGALLPALLVHLVLLLAEIRPWSMVQRSVVALAYGLAIVFGGASALAEENRAFGPGVAVLGIPGPILDWSWVGFRIVVLGLAAWWIWEAQAGRGRGRDQPRPQLLSMFGAVLCGALGGGVAIIMDDIGGPTWPGTTLIATAFIFAAYATFRSDLFFAPETARRILWYSLGGALIIAAVALAMTAINETASRWLGLDNPLPTAVVLVVILGFFDPVRNALGTLLGAQPADSARRRLLVAIGSDVLDGGAPDRVRTLVDELRRAIGSASMRLLDADGVSRAGSPNLSAESAHLVVPVEPGGQLLVGPKMSGLPYTPTDWTLLQESASYITSTFAIDHISTLQAQALTGLQQRQRDLRMREASLTQSLTRATTRDYRLDVYALGSLQVQRAGAPVQYWGGPKAGTRQAEGIFAFLFDRGERGVMKDEITELVWPDVELHRADPAFHRTLGGLRRRLSEGLQIPISDVIVFHNDRYRLNPDVVRWSDLGEFEERLASARAAVTPEERRQSLEAAYRLYRGDYLDDCPFYGDSSEVEERRQFLRGRCTDVLLALAELHEQQGDRTASAGFFREALAVNGQHCPPADEGLRRIGMTG
jgi:hypothetical protein